MEMLGLPVKPQGGNKCGHGEADPCYEWSANDVLKINTSGQATDFVAQTQPARAGYTDKFTEYKSSNNAQSNWLLETVDKWTEVKNDASINQRKQR